MTERILNATEKPNSFTFRHGGVGSEAKIYFDGEKDLIEGIDAVLKGRAHIQDKMGEQK